MALETNSEAYLPVVLSLIKLHVRSLWHTLKGGKNGLDLWDFEEDLQLEHGKHAVPFAAWGYTLTLAQQNERGPTNWKEGTGRKQRMRRLQAMRSLLGKKPWKMTDHGIWARRRTSTRGGGDKIQYLQERTRIQSRSVHLSAHNNPFLQPN